MCRWFCVLLVLLTMLLTSCANMPKPADVNKNSLSLVYGHIEQQQGDGPGQIERAVLSAEPTIGKLERSKYGNPASYQVRGKTYTTLDSAEGYRQKGIASWYGRKFHGRLTSSREVYDMYKLTAAHRSLPIPTYAKVTNLDNGKSIVVKINDRGPFHDDRIIDLSYAAAVQLDVVKKGTASVEVRTLTFNKSSQTESTDGSAKDVLLGTDNRTRHNPELRDGMYIQLGAFSDKANALTMEGRVREIIPGAVVHIVHSIDNKIYAVRLGPLHSKSLVNDLVNELNRGGLKDQRIIIN